MVRGGTSAWGPPMWQTIHFVALAYRGERSDEYVSFFESLRGVIPCRTCAEHYAQHLEQDPVKDNLKDNHALFDWTVRLHNAVNTRLGKREWKYNEARDHYSQLVFSSSSLTNANNKKKGDPVQDVDFSRHASCPSYMHNVWWVVIVVLLTLIVVIPAAAYGTYVYNSYTAAKKRG